MARLLAFRKCFPFWILTELQLIYFPNGGMSTLGTTVTVSDR